MLIHQDVAFHNVAQLEPAEANGVYLRRLPRAVRDRLSPLGSVVACDSAGCEIRFVTDSPSFRLTLSCLPSVMSPYEIHQHDVLVFRGSFLHSHHRVTPGMLHHLNVVNFQGTDVFDSLRPELRHGSGFSHQVWRIFFGRYAAAFHALDTYGRPRRPPTPDEVPERKWVAYGSSITHGASPTVHVNSYVYHAARLAGLDVCNLGLSGSCLCEPEMARELASRSDARIMTLEIGVNMRSSFTPQQFQQRSDFLLDTLRAASPRKPIVLISSFPNAASAACAADPSQPLTVNQEALDRVLRETCDRRRDPNLHLIEGSKILQSVADLTQDLIHPSDFGHARMGAALGLRLQRILSDDGATNA
jgi:hypothetical protein